MHQIRKGLIGVIAAGCALVIVPAASAPAATVAGAPEDTVWLCRPGLADNPCELDRTATIVAADGAKEVEPEQSAKRQPIDCFYVYPTVSGQTTINADLTPDPEVIAVAEQQASRFSQVCRVFAPVYRQVTIMGLFSADTDESAFATAYDDVRNAWRDYLEHDNKGRGVVFIGHSQGTGMLVRLLQDEVDTQAARRRRTVSALLIGGDVTVAAGKDVGGSFEHLPACRAAKQTACVVAYSAFSELPPPESLFGRISEMGSGVLGEADPDDEVLCVNPADLSRVGGGNGGLVPYFRTEPFPGTLGAVEPVQFPVDTPWAQPAELYAASCASEDGASWLQVDHAVGDPRPQVPNALGPTWGLHLVDVTLALGNLVDLVRIQSKAYAAKS